MEYTQPRGDITTLVDLVTRDSQDDYFTPLTSQTTWFARDKERRNRPFVPAVQTFAYRGPAAFGQRFTFDIGSTSCGDILFGLYLQINLGHWFDPTTVLRIQSGRYTYENPEEAWFYANSLGTAILAKVELEVEDQIIEAIDGDFAFTAGRLFPDLNAQVGPTVDGTATVTIPRLKTWDPQRVFPTESGTIFCPLSFFFSRTSLKEAFPLIACREGTVRVNITLRPFKECVRIASGVRSSPDDTPLGRTFSLIDHEGPFDRTISVTAASAAPGFSHIQLVTYGAYLDGSIRESMLRDPFEMLHRGVETFRFTEPLKYVANTPSVDKITIQLPLEANHPMEEIVWFLRRKAPVALNNEWTNYTSVASSEYDATFNYPTPYLVSASIQVNGVELIQADELYYRQLIARHHRGGIAPFASYIYGYPIARNPSQHQPSGTLNASRSQSIRLTLVVSPPGGSLNQEWEVVVYVLGLRWLRFENGIANKMFED